MLVRRLDSQHDMVFGSGHASYYRDNQAAIAQNIKTRIWLILGEFFLDVNAGTPWQQILGVKPYSGSLVESILRTRIHGTEGITGITEFHLDFNPRTREAWVVAMVTTIFSSQPQEIRMFF